MCNWCGSQVFIYLACATFKIYNMASYSFKNYGVDIYYIIDSVYFYL